MGAIIPGTVPRIIATLFLPKSELFPRTGVVYTPGQGAGLQSYRSAQIPPTLACEPGQDTDRAARCSAVCQAARSSCQALQSSRERAC